MATFYFKSGHDGQKSGQKPIFCVKNEVNFCRDFCKMFVLAKKSGHVTTFEKKVGMQKT
jgi:hypothetical protein